MDRQTQLYVQNYVDKTLRGLGALQGTPCEIQSVTPIYQNDKVIGNTVTFKWHDNQNHTHIKPISVMNGQNEGGNMQVGDIRSLIKVAPYLYKIEYDNLNQDYAKNWFNNNYTGEDMGGCSCVRKGNYYGRNQDWNYDTAAEFIVRVPAINGRHASIGMAAVHEPALITEDLADSRILTDAYKILPFRMLDGINDAGLVCNVNVVPRDNGLTAGTHPSVATRETICMGMLVRYILDNFATVDEAIDYLQKYVSIYAPQSEYMNTEEHFMLADATTTKVIEFIDNVLTVVDVTNDKPYMTNFFLTGMEMEDETTVDKTSLTPFSAGVERYEIIAQQQENLEDATDVLDLMSDDLKYTNAQDLNQESPWYSEFTGDQEEYGLGTIVVTDAPETFAPIMEAAYNEYVNRDRENPTTWQTVHSIVQNINTKTFTVVVQEDTSRTQTETL